MDDRLPERIAKHIAPEPNSGCWLWMGCVAPNGYPKVARKHDGGGWTTANAHREVYKILVGDIPEGLDLDHKCKVRCCVNPAHVKLATRAENMANAESNRKAMLARTHCKRGHEFNEASTRWFRSPWTGEPVRQCRPCLRVAQRRFHLENIEERRAANRLYAANKRAAGVQI